MIASSRTKFLCVAGFVALDAVGCGDSSSGTGGSSSASTTSSSTGAGGTIEPAFNVPDISLSQGGFQAESSVAATKGGVVAATWITLTQAAVGIGYSFSTDGGKTWLAPAGIPPINGFFYGDPTVVAGDDGSFYLAFCAVNKGFTAGHVYVAKAAPGATTFGTPVQVSDPADPGPYDKPVIAITKSQAILVSYTHVATGHVVVGRSADGAASFTRTEAVSNVPYGALATPCADPDGGRVWLTFIGNKRIDLRWSDDDGATFPQTNATRVSPTTELDVSTDDPVCVGRGSEVWVAYSRSHDIVDSASFNWKDYALRLAHSSDGGATIDSRTDVFDAASGTFFMEPALVLEPNNALDLTYYTGNVGDDPAGTFRLARSTDGGQTFLPTTVIEQPVTFALNRNGKTWLGDYSGFVAFDGRLYTTYADNASGSSHVSFMTMPIPAE